MSSTEAPQFDQIGAWAKLHEKIGGIAGGILKPGGSKPKGAVAQRKAGERKPVAAGDGRRGQFTGRTAVLNTKLKPEFREKLFALAAERGIGIAALLEQVLEEWESMRGK